MAYGFITYKTVVDYFEAAANAHQYVQTFGHGGLDQLDAKSQNVAYPYVFLRPITSPGYNEDTRIRTLAFELYALDVPKLSNTEPLDIMSRMEMVLLDIGGYFNWGPPSDNQTEGYDLTFTSIIPTLEAFNDRAYGWVANITVDTKGTYDYCDYPSGSYV